MPSLLMVATASGIALIGAGALVEFVYNKREVSSISQWGAWVKGGASFDKRSLCPANKKHDKAASYKDDSEEEMPQHINQQPTVQIIKNESESKTTTTNIDATSSTPLTVETHTAPVLAKSTPKKLNFLHVRIEFKILRIFFI